MSEGTELNQPSPEALAGIIRSHEATIRRQAIKIAELQAATPKAGPPLAEGKALVDFDALRDILKALVNEPHRVRELQATQQPPELFPNNPINVLIQDFYAACRVRQGVSE